MVRMEGWGCARRVNAAAYPVCVKTPFIKVEPGAWFWHTPATPASRGGAASILTPPLLKLPGKLHKLAPGT